MSEPVSALGGASATTGIAAITELGPMGMITLRGDLSLRKMRKLVTKTTGADFPDVRRVETAQDCAVAWMSPDELLVMCPYVDVGDTAARMTTALEGEHALVANVSDARAVFEVSGPQARDVLAKLAPVDLDPAQFTPGMFRRTRLAQVAAAFWMTDDQTFRIVCFRSVAQYVFDLLSVAAQSGSEVGHYSVQSQRM